MWERESPVTLLIRLFLQLPLGVLYISFWASSCVYSGRKCIYKKKKKLFFFVEGGSGLIASILCPSLRKFSLRENGIDTNF